MIKLILFIIKISLNKFHFFHEYFLLEIENIFRCGVEISDTNLKVKTEIDLFCINLKSASSYIPLFVNSLITLRIIYSDTEEQFQIYIFVIFIMA